MLQDAAFLLNCFLVEMWINIESMQPRGTGHIHNLCSGDMHCWNWPGWQKSARCSVTHTKPDDTDGNSRPNCAIRNSRAATLSLQGSKRPCQQSTSVTPQEAVLCVNERQPWLKWQSKTAFGKVGNDRCKPLNREDVSVKREFLSYE